MAVGDGVGGAEGTEPGALSRDLGGRTPQAAEDPEGSEAPEGASYKVRLYRHSLLTGKERTGTRGMPARQASWRESPFPLESVLVSACNKCPPVCFLLWGGGGRGQEPKAS